MLFSNVDFPAPDFPIIEYFCPGLISKSNVFLYYFVIMKVGFESIYLFWY